MGVINNITQKLHLRINAFLSMVGVSLVGIALYLIFANWGSLDSSFFLGGGIAMALFGMILSTLSYLGCQGVNNQERVEGRWNGRRILGIYQLFLLGALIGECLAVSVGLSVIRQFEVAHNALDSGETASMGNTERMIADKFNSFYFSAITQCGDAAYASFLSFIDDHCPSTIHQMKCLKCEDYQITSCYADESDCSNYPDHIGPSCPYGICRNQVLSYLLGKVKPLTYFIIAFTSFQVILFFLNIMLICYNRHDSVAEILYKNGTLSSPKSATGRTKVPQHEDNANRK